MCCLSDIDYYTLFYHIASFEDWIENENATATRCLYVDIDDVGINANEGDKDTVISFLKNELKLKESEFPDFGILSGHGLHACWLIDEITPKDEELREKYLGSLITRMCGDFSGFPISHQFRCPCSYNLKDEKIKGKLFKLTDCSNTDIHRLDWCLKTPEEILEYRSNYYTRVFEKGLATAEKNRQLEKEFLDAGDSMDGTGPLRRFENPEEYIKTCAEYEDPEKVPSHLVPATQFFFIRKSDNKLVGICIEHRCFYFKHCFFCDSS